MLQTDIVLHIDETGVESDFKAISEDAAWYKFNVVVDSNALAGQYVLAENLGNAQGDCVIWGYDSETSETLAVDACVRIDANTYTKQVVDDKLVLTVKTAPRTIHWEEVENASGYAVEFTQDHFESVMQLLNFGQDRTQVDLLNLPNGEYDYRIRAFDDYDELVWSGSVVIFEDDDWMIADTITVKNNVVSELRVADEDDRCDLLFGNARGIWDAKYQARHVGVGEWTGTRQTVALGGKNIITDVFQGSGYESILLLTDDDNGDALFIDDIYSLFPEGVDAQSRLARIDEIVAGAGDDVIDLTSQRFEYIGDGLIVFGGLGDDVIWANKGDNILFGDAGNDHITGASGNDVLVGGSGNDTLHGGGGKDIFAFGGTWGHDIVEQLADGEVTLWFKDGDESMWNERTLTYTDGDNSVQVKGVGKESISLKFSYGDKQPELAFEEDGSVQYGYLEGIGAFDDFTTEKVFEDRNKGLLA